MARVLFLLCFCELCQVLMRTMRISRFLKRVTEPFLELISFGGYQEDRNFDNTRGSSFIGVPLNPISWQIASLSCEGNSLDAMVTQSQERSINRSPGSRSKPSR
ncbi:hypothetical protein DFH94DRAFT_785106 [Russula ochroleuca]|uniref:Secreted protein n=1 Tax=Russula ochroleuca TaxID=152965 RepID=A0A9P5JVL1_9AGAM|nr:hypothetical protein DFH94DRAFT_785106 [Russula ochroleuca]